MKKLNEKIEENEGLLPLPLILNKKTVDNVPVYQVESAMGAAINVFENSKALVVQRDRFLPVKKTNDLLIIWSDRYNLNKDFTIKLSEKCTSDIIVDLDEKYYKTIDEMQKHFPADIPSLIHCTKLDIKGNVFFDGKVIVKGDVKIVAHDELHLKNITLSDETYSK